MILLGLVTIKESIGSGFRLMCSPPPFNKPHYGVVGDIASPTYPEVRHALALSRDPSLNSTHTERYLDLADVIGIFRYFYYGDTPGDIPGELIPILIDVNGDRDVIWQMALIC